MMMMTVCVRTVCPGVPSDSTSINARCSISAVEQTRVDLRHPSVFRTANRNNIATENKIASIHSVHGKRLTSTIPLHELFSAKPRADARHQHAHSDAQHRTKHRQTPTSSTINCHSSANVQLSSLPRITQHSCVADSISLPSSDRQISSAAGVPPQNDYDAMSGPTCHAGWPGSTDVSVRSRSADSKQLENAQLRAQSSVDTNERLNGQGRPSSRSEFGRRRRPVSVMESAQRGLPGFDTSSTIENVVSAVDDEMLLPPPPEFDDSFTAASTPVCVAVPVRHDSDTSRACDGWTVDEVCAWLVSVDLGEHCASFRVENVDGFRLRTLGRSDLIGFGLTAVGDRMKFERSLMKVLNR